MQTCKVGIIGCGTISRQYLKASSMFPILEVAACADLQVDRAQTRANEFGIARACSVHELLADRDIELVVNLTVPKAHASVALAAIEAGKHVWNEKPIAVTRQEAERLLEAASAQGVSVGCAPDTFLGASQQLARRLLDEGAIGKPVAATAFMLSRGPESWHPDPAFYYQPGGGPLLDMGPYYFTALINLLGPIKRIGGSAVTAIPVRTIGSGPKRGQTIQVEVADHVTGTLEFESDVVATTIISFATAHNSFAPITIFGTEGTLQVPDPNSFDGEVQVRHLDDDWQTVVSDEPQGYGRSAGVAEMAHALRSGRACRASGQLGFAVLDAMQGLLEASQTGRTYSIVVPHERPAPVPTGLSKGVFD